MKEPNRTLQGNHMTEASPDSGTEGNVYARVAVLIPLAPKQGAASTTANTAEHTLRLPESRGSLFFFIFLGLGIVVVKLLVHHDLPCIHW